MLLDVLALVDCVLCIWKGGVLHRFSDRSSTCKVMFKLLPLSNQIVYNVILNIFCLYIHHSPRNRNVFVEKGHSLCLVQPDFQDVQKTYISIRSILNDSSD